MLQTTVLIVGAGPTGTSCSLRLQQAGIDCLVVDKAKFPRVKLCGGLFTAKSEQSLLSLLGAESYQDILKQCTVEITHNIALYNTDQLLARSAVQPLRFIDRPCFDHAMFNLYQSRGGQSIEGKGISSIDFDQQIATLQDGDQVHYKYLVAADGASSRTEHLLAAYSQQHKGDFTPKGHNSFCLEINVPREEMPPIDEARIYFGLAPKTYAWAFPKGDVVCLGIGSMYGNDFDTKAGMKQFLQMVGLRHPERYPLHGAVIPYHNLLTPPVWHSHLLFAGDAAGLIEPLTGEGIYYAIQSGMDAAEAIIKASNISVSEEASAVLTQYYTTAIQGLHRNIEMSDFYQSLLLNHKLLSRLFFYLAPKHTSFIGFFFDRRISQGQQMSLVEFIRLHHKVERTNGHK